jgi:hypothetical protein
LTRIDTDYHGLNLGKKETARIFRRRFTQIIADLFNPKPVLVETGIGNQKLVPAQAGI